MVQLTAGSCLALHNANPSDVSVFEATHTLQLLSVRSITFNDGLDRYRTIFSDGEHFIQAMLATQLNDLVRNNEAKKNTIVNITEMTCHFVQDKRLFIILQLEVLEQLDHKIGDPTVLNSPPASICPIEGLSPYQSYWTIKARVTQKSDLKKYSNQKGEGQLFNVTLVDDTGQIKATAFNQVAVELYPQLQENKVYYISRARVNFAKKQFSHSINEYELGLERNTVIHECFDATSAPNKYNFMPLGELQGAMKDSICNVIGIVKEASAISAITSRNTNRKVVKRELLLADCSEFLVRMTLWGTQAEQFDGVGQVIAFQNVRVSDFGGRSLSFFSSSSMNVDPDIPDAHALWGWFDEDSEDTAFHAHYSTGGGGAGGPGFQRSQIRALDEVRRAELCMEGKEQYFSTRATIVFIKPDSLWYPACQGDNCSEKVTDLGGEWHCENCHQTWPRPRYRYIMSMACSDHADQAWLQGFNDVGEMVFGRTADEMVKLKEADDEGPFTQTVQMATCEQYNFLCCAQSVDYYGQTRARYSISRIAPLNYKEEAMYLRDQLLNTPWGQTAV